MKRLRIANELVSIEKVKIAKIMNALFSYGDPDIIELVEHTISHE